MERKQFEYEVNGNRYLQRRLVYGQIIQLNEVVKGIRFPVRPNPAGPEQPPVVSMVPADWVEALGATLIEVLGVALIPEDGKLEDKDPAALARELRWSLDAETTMQAAEDFFDCNPLSSLSDLGERATRLLAKLLPKPAESGTASGPTLPGSPAATLSADGPSSGAARQTTSGPTLTGS